MPEEIKQALTGREKRQQGRVDKLTKEIKAEAKQAGVDLDTTSDIGPLISERKARIDKTLQEGVKGDTLAGLQKIQSVRQAPEIDVAKKPVIDLDIKDVRKERRAKIANIMNAFGQGLAGESVDAFKYTRPLKEERLSQYQQYKDVSRAAKQKQEEWVTGYINEQLDYLKAKLDDPRTSELKRRQIQKEIERTEAQTAQIKAKTKQLQTGKDEEDEPTARVVQKTDTGTLTYDMPLEEAKVVNEINNDIKAANDKLLMLMYDDEDDNALQIAAARGTIKALKAKKQQLISKQATTKEALSQ